MVCQGFSFHLEEHNVVLVGWFASILERLVIFILRIKMNTAK